MTKTSERMRLPAGQQPIIHRDSYVNRFWPLDPSLKNKFSCPEELTIVTLHNYKKKSIFEESLDFLGVNYVFLTESIEEWRHTYMLEWIFKFLQSDKCKTEYLLYCDARDSILMDDPLKVLNLFKKTQRDLIFNATRAHKGGRSIFHKIPMLLEWSRSVAEKKNRYLNTGAFIGKTKFIREVFKVAVTLIGRFPSPYDDQHILRFLWLAFYPEMNLDWFNEMFFRN